MASAYNTSSAYNFSYYEAQLENKKRLDKEELRVVKAPKHFLVSLITPKTLCVFAMTVTLICLMVYNNVCLTEVTGEINELTNGISELHSENVRMQSEIKSLVSPRSVAQIAENELGLKRLDKYQTEYIYLNREDKVELTEISPSMGVFGQVKAAFDSFVRGVKEYIAAW